MRFLVKLVLAIPRLLISFVWNVFFSLFKVVILLILIVGGLWYYANHSSSSIANQLSNVFETVSTVFNGDSLSSPQAFSKRLKQLETDSHEHLNGARWPTNTASVYIATENETFRNVYNQAIEAWNQTGAFQFRLVTSPEKANIIAKDYSDASTQAAGLANIQTNALTNRFKSVEVFLNAHYLLDPKYGYDQDRMVNTAEHELGHAIGLDHDDTHESVMQSSGSYYGIQESDIKAVRKLYQAKKIAA